MSEKKAAVKLPLDQMGFLSLCAGLELKLAEVYHYFEELFAEDIPFSLLWNKTAREEENHAQQFNLGVRLKGVGMKCLNGDVSQAIVFLRKAETYLENTIGSHPSKEEALTIAIKLEEQLTALHMSRIVVFEDPELQNMFDAMMKSDEGHVSTLIDYRNKLRVVREN